MKLVYRVKVEVETRDGALKPGMPADAVLPLEPRRSRRGRGRRRRREPRHQGHRRADAAHRDPRTSGSRSATARSRRCATSTFDGARRASSSVWSVPTAPARRRSCACSPCLLTPERRARRRSTASTSPTIPPAVKRRIGYMSQRFSLSETLTVARESALRRRGVGRPRRRAPQAHRAPAGVQPPRSVPGSAGAQPLGRHEAEAQRSPPA